MAAVLSDAHPAGRASPPRPTCSAPGRRCAPIADLAHAVGALVYVDGVHFTAHAPVDVAALGADFFACSPYKFLGPHCGVLAADPALLETLRPDKLLPSTDAVPERFELGTLPYELLAGTTAAVDFLAALGERSAGRGASGCWRRWPPSRPTRTACAPGSRRASRSCRASPCTPAPRTAPRRCCSGMGGREQEAYAFLAERGVNAPAGSFYALEASRRLGLGDTGGLRVGLAPYIDDTDVDRLLDALSAFAGAS